MTKSIKQITLTTLSFIVIICGVIIYNSSASATEITFSQATIQPTRVVPNTNQILSFHDVIKDSMNSVVNITVKLKPQQSSERSIVDDPFFRQFMDPRYPHAPQKENIPKGAGSGVIIASDGLIVTNNHVIDGATEIMVMLPDNKKEYKAKLIGSDKGSDLAVIKIEATNLLPIKMGNIKDVKVGDIVFAIGNPFGVGETVTSGIVSALNKQELGINQYENFIQTDASINPGNSGGALVDSRGVMIGINSAIFSKGGGNDGIGFTIPVDMMQNVVSQIVKNGKVSRGYMGVSLAPLDSTYSKAYNSQNGVVVTDVEPDGAAYKAGLKRGDLIIAIDGIAIESPSKLQMLIGDKKPNESTVVTIERATKVQKLSLRLGNRESALAKISQNINGMDISVITPKIKQGLRLTLSNGIVVINIDRKSPMYNAGFRVGDVIIQVENDTMSSLENVKKALLRNGLKRVFVNRYGKIGIITVQQ